MNNKNNKKISTYLVNKKQQQDNATTPINYIRITQNNTTADDGHIDYQGMNYMAISNIEIYVNGNSTNYLSDTGKFTYSVSSQQSDREAEKAFDDNTGTRWQTTFDSTNGNWMQINFTDPIPYNTLDTILVRNFDWNTSTFWRYIQRSSYVHLYTDDPSSASPISSTQISKENEWGYRITYNGQTPQGDIDSPRTWVSYEHTTISISENSTDVHTFSSSETDTWSLNGGDDESKFTINSGTGALSFISAPDFENPTDTDTDNDYVVIVRATDSAGNTSDQTVTVNVTNVDETATIQGQTSGTGDEDGGAITGTLTVTDPDGFTNNDPFSVTTNGTNGTASIQANGSWSYTPVNNFHGTDSFTVTITDDAGFTQTQTIDITVNAKNDAATIGGNTSGTGDEDGGAITGQLNVTDAIDGFTNGYTNNTNYSIMSNNHHTTVVNGIEYVIKSRKYGVSGEMTTDELDTYMREVTTTPWYGDIDLAYQIATEAGTGISGFTGKNSQNMYGPNFIYEITGNTMSAVRQHDGENSNGYSNTMNSTTNIRGDIMVAYIVSIDKFGISGTPSNGTATIDNDGNWSYTPVNNFHGTDSFTVTITDDDGHTETQTIDITVNPTNDTATIGGDISGTGVEDGGAITGQLTVTDAIDGFTPSTITHIDTSVTVITPSDINSSIRIRKDTWSLNSSVIDNLHNLDGILNINDVSYTITGLESDNGTFMTYYVNPDPGMLTTSNRSVNTTYTTNLFSVTTDGTNGTATIEADGSWSYTPDANFNGTDSFIVTITDDDSHTETQTINITVNPINDAATIGGDTSGTSDESGLASGTLTVTDTADGFTNATPYSIASESATNTIDFDQYAIAEGGVESTYKTHNLSAIYSGDWIFEDISPVDTGGLTAWNSQIEVISEDDTNWTIVRLSHVDGINFSLNNFDYWSEGAHTYKIVSDTGYEYQVNTYDSPFGMDTLVDQNILDSYFSDISYVDFYSQAITYLEFGMFEETQTKWHLDNIELSYSDNATNGTATIGADGSWSYTPNQHFIGADSFVVTITDDDGHTQTQTINVTIVPKVDSVTSSTANNTYKIDDEINITVNFNATVNVTGIPQITLATGANDGAGTVVDYVLGDGTSSLIFKYTVAAGDNTSDLNYISTTALELNNGTATITDANGNNANLTLPATTDSLGDNKEIVIDGIVPTISITSGTNSSNFWSHSSDGLINTEFPTYTNQVNIDNASFNNGVVYINEDTKVVITENITIDSTSKYLRLNGDNIGIDGQNKIITVTIDNYGGFIHNGDKSSNAVCANFMGKNLRVESDKQLYSSVPAGVYGGWICRDRFGWNLSNENFIFENCSSNGDISRYGGGIVGAWVSRNSSNVNITFNNCYSTGDINREGGGISGAHLGYEITNSTITYNNCYSTGDIALQAGGICSMIWNWNNNSSGSVATFNNCYSTGDIASQAGGIVGYYSGARFGLDSKLIVNNCFSTGEISADAGGIFGAKIFRYRESENVRANANNCYSIGEIVGANGGGILGSESPGEPYISLSNCIFVGGTSSDIQLDEQQTAGNWKYNNALATIGSTNDSANIWNIIFPLKAGETVPITFTFSESVTGFVENDIEVTGGTLSSLSGSGTTYTTTFIPTADSTTDGVISVANNKFYDTAGNENIDGSDANNTLTFSVNTIIPTITGPSGSAGDATSTISISENSTAVHTFSASETVTWTLNGGDDEYEFTIDSNTGALSFTSAPNYENPTDVDSSNNYEVTVRATGTTGNTSDQTVTVSVTNVDETATIQGQTSETGDEDGGAITGTLTVTDPDGFTNNDPFSVSTNGTNGTASIQANGTWSYTPDDHFNGTDSFIVTITDDAGFTQTQTIDITVNPINDAATIGGDISGIGSGTLTGQLTVTDVIDGFTGITEYSNDTSYSNMGDGEATIIINNTEYVIKSRKYTDSTAFNQEVTNSPWYGDIEKAKEFALACQGNISQFLFSATNDKHGPHFIYQIINNNMSFIRYNTDHQHDDGTYEDVTMGIDKFDERYTAYVVSSTIVTFAVTTDGTNGTATIDNDGNWSYTPNQDFYGTDSFVVTITDDDGHTETQTITVTNIIKINSVTSSTANNTYKISDVINIAINFNTTVYVTGTPQLTLATGANGATTDVDYVSGSGTSSLVFEYTVEAGDNTSKLDYTSETALALNSGTIKDINGNDAILTLPEPEAADSLGGNKEIVIDGIVPTIAITSDVATLKAGETATITFTLSESTDFVKDDIEVSGGTLSSLSGSGTTYTATFTPNADSTTDGVISVASNKFSDAAGNENIYENYANTTTYSSMGQGQATITIDYTEYVIKSRKYTDSTTFNQEVTNTPWYGDIEKAKEFALACQGNISGFLNNKTNSKYGPHFIYQIINNNMSFIRYNTDSPHHHDDGTYENVELSINKWDERYTAYVVSSKYNTLTLSIDTIIPIITGPSGNLGAATESISIIENTKDIHTFTASETVTWNVDGVDASKFNIGSNTGALSFSSTPDFENPIDDNTDNVYVVNIIATDSAGNTSNQLVSITVIGIDDEKPYIISSNKASIMEQSGTNQIVYKSFANDVDSNLSDLTFYLDAPIDSETGEITLSIDSKNGEVTLIPNPVYEDKSEYIFNVYAKDKNENTSYTKTVTLNITPAYIKLKQPDKNGLPQDDIIIPVEKGWNLIGTTNANTLIPNNLIVSDSVYMFEETYIPIPYSESHEGYPLEANTGYWIKCDW